MQLKDGPTWDGLEGLSSTHMPIIYLLFLCQAKVDATIHIYVCVCVCVCVQDQHQKPWMFKDKYIILEGFISPQEMGTEQPNHIQV